MFKTIISKLKSRKAEARLHEMERQREIEDAARALKQRMERLLAQRPGSEIAA